VAVVSAVVPRNRRVASQARGRGYRVDGLIRETRLHEPVDDLAAAIPAGEPGAPPYGEIDLPSRGQQLIGDLATRLAASDDQHGAGGQLRRAAIVACVELEYLGWERLRERGWRRALVRAGRHDNRVRREGSSVRLDVKPAAVPPNARYLDAFP